MRTSCDSTVCEWRTKRNALSMPPHSRSAGRREGGCGRGGYSRTDCSSTRMPATAQAKTQPLPSAANTQPASAGPSARALLYEMPTTVIACGSSGLGTTSTMAEFQLGLSMAVQQPARKVRNSSVAGPAQPAKSSAVISATIAACTMSAIFIMRARSVVSAITPAGRASRNIGRNTAVCTSAARKLLPLISTISHAVAMACMALPMK